MRQPKLMKVILLYITLVLAVKCSYAQTKDTFEIYFPFNKSTITKEAEYHIDALIFKDTLIHGDKLIVLGYADYVGGKGHNDSLSYLRARAVRNYLLKYGFDKKDIALCIGKGQIQRSTSRDRAGYATDRKVQIVIDHTAPAPPPPPPPAKPRPEPKPTPPPVTAKPMEKVDIEELKVNESFAINNISFEAGTPHILQESHSSLETLLGYMNKYPTLRIRIEGHICCMGPVEGADDIQPDGSTLSALRAQAVGRYLIAHGIDRHRLESIGLGNRNPVAPADETEEDHVKNRRVEIRILSK